MLALARKVNESIILNDNIKHELYEGDLWGGIMPFPLGVLLSCCRMIRWNLALHCGIFQTVGIISLSGR